MTVVYADSVFVLNSAMDYLILLATARLAGLPLRRWRYLAAALCGGAYAVAAFLPGCGFLAEGAVKAAAGILMALVAFGSERKLLRLSLLFCVVSCALAGCVLGLGQLSGGLPTVNGIYYTDVDVRVLLIAAAAAYLVLTVVFRAAAYQVSEGRILRVRVCLEDRMTEFSALWDNGNTLRDPMSGEAVLVTAPGALRAVLGREVNSRLTPEALRAPADILEELAKQKPALHPRLIPYRAVGVSGGMLLTICADWIEVEGERYSRGWIALSPTALGTEYEALWGGEVPERMRRHEKADTVMETCHAEAGACAGHWHPLYRGKRYPAGPAEQRAGGGTAGTSGGAGGAAGTD